MGRSGATGPPRRRNSLSSFFWAPGQRAEGLVGAASSEKTPLFWVKAKKEGGEKHTILAF